MGKIFDALKKKADPIADPVLDAAAAAPPIEAPLAPVRGPVPGFELAAILAGSSLETKTAGEISVMRSQTAAEIGMDRTAANLPLVQGPGLETEAEKPLGTDFKPAGNSPISKGALLAEPHIFDPWRARTLPIRVPGGDPLLPFDSGPSRASEQYRYLRTKLVQDPRKPRTILVSSPGPGDGKTLTAVNLTGVLSLKASAAVVLVDGDLRRSSLHKHLRIPKSPGLVDLLRGTCTIEDVLIHAEQFPNLFVIPAGESKENPAELLDSAVWTSIVQQLRAAFKYVVIDSPPVGSVADYHLIEASCDGVVLVVRPDYTSRTMTMKALEMVPKEKSLGVVLNCVSDWFITRHTQFDYSYHYALPEEPAKASKR